MKDDHPILDYAAAERTSPLRRLAKISARYVAITAFLFVLGVIVPFPEGIWYFGHRPQWMLAVDSMGLTIGPTDRAVSLGPAPVMVIKLLVVGVPIWLASRYASWSRSPSGAPRRI